MTTANLYADLIRRADACEASVRDFNRDRLTGKAAAYRHAAELLRCAVAAAVEEERAACVLAVAAAADACGVVAWPFIDAIRARGEAPRVDAASGGQGA